MGLIIAKLLLLILRSILVPYPKINASLAGLAILPPPRSPSPAWPVFPARDALAALLCGRGSQCHGYAPEVPGVSGKSRRVAFVTGRAETRRDETPRGLLAPLRCVPVGGVLMHLVLRGDFACSFQALIDESAWRGVAIVIPFPAARVVSMW